MPIKKGKDISDEEWDEPVSDEDLDEYLDDIAKGND